MEDLDYGLLRHEMVTAQLISRGITDEHVLEAMRKVPRHLFVEERLRHSAYSDSALRIGEGQTISQPYMVALMTELLDLNGSEKVLEVGTGSGYQTAILAELSREVYSVERHESLSEMAREILSSLNYENITLKSDDGTLGWPEKSPFERILITAGAPEIPHTLIDQLGDGGIIVAPIGNRLSQVLIKMQKKGRELSTERHTSCVFVPLIGEQGWKDSP